MRRISVVLAVLLVLWPPAEAAATNNESSCPGDDYESSFQAFITLADEGNPTAQLLLGVMYAEGKGVPQDLVSAYFWLSMSADQGNADAATFLDVVVERMTSHQKGH